MQVEFLKLLVMETGTSNVSALIEALSLSEIPGLPREAKARQMNQLLLEERFEDAVGCVGSIEELQVVL